MEHWNEIRRSAGFLTLPELEALAGANLIFDPYSTLIGRGVRLGTGNLLYPGVILQCAPEGCLTIGNGNEFLPGAHLDAGGGLITVGDGNRFGDGPVSIHPGGAVTIGDGCRLDGRIDILGVCCFGSGAQVLGSIRAYDCTLAPGGSYREPDPDLRAGVLKGCGTARGLTVPRGMVINGPGVFRRDMLEPQSNYHPKPAIKKEVPHGTVQ